MLNSCNNSIDKHPNRPNGNILQGKWKKLFKIIVMFKNNYQVSKDQEAFYNKALTMTWL